MKKVFLALVLFIFMFNLEAQRLDIDKVSFDYSYRLLPNIPLDKSYVSYTVKITKSDNLGPFASIQDSSKINIPGRKKVPTQAYFTVNINLGEVTMGKPEVKSRVDVSKDKDGKETGRKTLYHVEFRYSFEATTEVTDYNGTILANYKISTRDNAKTYKSTEYSTRELAAGNYNNQTKEISERIICEEINNAYTSFNESLTNDFGIKDIWIKYHLWNVGTQKHTEYQECKNACAKAKAALEMITPYSIPNEINEQIKPAIEYFSGIEIKYTSTEEKTEKKLRYAAFYNLAIIYLCLEQYEKTKEYAQKLMANDFDSNDGKDFIQAISTIQARLEKHKMATQHFAFDMQNISPPQ
jgi:hypothetical protein